MTTIRNLAMQWWVKLPNNYTGKSKGGLANDYGYGYKKSYSDLTEEQIENIFYNEVIFKWYDELGGWKYAIKIRPNNYVEDLKQFYLQEHSKEEQAAKFEKGEVTVIKGSPLHQLLKQHPLVEHQKEEIKLFNPLTTDHECFAIKNNEAFIGYKIPNGNFHFESIKFTQPKEEVDVWETKYKALLDSHNELLNKVEKLSGYFWGTEKEWQDVQLLINKTKNI